MAALGALLRRHRARAGLSQEELAYRAGLSARAISDIERGLRSRVYADTADRLAGALVLDAGDRTAFLEAARARSLSVTSAASTTGIPAPLTTLVGREHELAELEAALQDHRLVSITGIGGLGKTRVAIAVAVDVLPAYEGRVHFLSMVANQDPLLVMGQLARAVGASEGTSPEALADHLSGRPTLVVLDAFEHAISGVAILARYLNASPELHVLATSRDRLKVAGEYELPLTPLPTPDPADPRWTETPAAALFLQRARDVGVLVNADPVLVTDICRRLSGLPLALELAAARLRHLPLVALRSRLETGLHDLVDTQPIDGRRSMEETLSWSISSLPGDEATALTRCAVFPDGWRLDAAQALCGQELDLVTATSDLVDKGLVFLDPRAPSGAEVPRWRMWDVVREFVLDARVPSDVRAAYQRFFLHLMKTTAKHVGREENWFLLLLHEQANVRAALTWAEEDNDAETLLGLANGMWQFWQANGDLSEGRHWLAAGLSLHPPATDDVRMTALWGEAWLAYHQGDDEAADTSADRLRALALRLRDAAGQRNAATLHGMLAISRDDPAMTITFLEHALGLARDLGEPWILATSLLNLGLGRLSAGDTDGARTVLSEALRRYDGIGDERFHARCLGYLGLTCLIEEDRGRAGALFRQSLRAFHRLGEPGGTAEGLVGIAAADAADGHSTRGATIAGAAERLRESFAGRELPLERRTTARYFDAARARIGADAWAAAWQQGRELSLDQSVQLALSSPGELP